MATPKKNTKDLSGENGSEKLNSKPAGSRYDEDEDDFDDMPLDDFESYDNGYEDDDDD